MQVKWEAPTVNADQTPLTDLAGFRVYYRSITDPREIMLDTGIATTAHISGLTPGETYGVMVTAYDFSGNESVRSEEAIFQVPLATTVEIIGPSEGVVVKPKSAVTVYVTVEHASGPALVEVYVNDVLRCSDNQFPYQCVWKVPSARGRSYRIQAFAMIPGNVAASSVVTVRTP